MKNLKLRKVLLISLISLLVATLCFAVVFRSEKKDAFANEVVNAQLFLPQTELEYQSLTSPIDVYHDDTVTAIAQGSDLISHTLTIYYQNKKTTLGGFTSLKQVKRLNQSSLIVLDNAGAYKIDLENLSTQTTPQLLYYTSNDQPDTIRGNHFDIQKDYLVTSFGVTAMIYNRVNGEFVHNPQNNFSVKTDSPLTMNSNGDIFYVSADGLVKINVNNINDIKVLLRGISPERIIADNQFVYFIINGDIYKADHTIPNTTEQKLMVDNSSNNFDLGKITIPKTISFKGNNILIVSEDTVQEFRVNGDVLEFTGYAIASGKTAYNRLTSNAKKVEKYGDKIAVLDSQKLTVITTKSTDSYDRANFLTFESSNFNGGIPTDFCLGNETLLFSYGNNAVGSKLYFKDYINDTTGVEITLPDNFFLQDTCYQSGYYYVLVTNNQSERIYALKEGMTTLDAYPIYDKEKSVIEATKLAVDVFGNIILSDGTKIEKFKKQNGYEKECSIDSIQTIKSIQTDIGGGVYFLDGNDIYYIKDNTAEKIDILMQNDAKIKSFALDIISKEVFFLCENKEFICKTDKLNNLALSDITFDNEYVISAKTAEFDKLKIYKAIDGANVYSMTKDGEKAIFNGLIEDREEYVYISSITINNDYNSVEFLALVGQHNSVLINSNEVYKINLGEKDTINSAFTATGVNMYYLPIITKDAEFSLKNENGVIRLEKGTEIRPEKVFTYLGCEFYFASVVIDGTTYKGYVPTAFTVEILSEDFKWDEYNIEELKSCTIFSDKELTNSLFEVANGTKARVYDIEDKVAYVAVEIDGEWKFGFVSEDSIKNQPSVAIRNSLIILAVAACVCGTTTYFIIKKQD